MTYDCVVEIRFGGAGQVRLAPPARPGGAWRVSTSTPPAWTLLDAAGNLAQGLSAYPGGTINGLPAGGEGDEPNPLDPASEFLLDVTGLPRGRDYLLQCVLLADWYPRGAGVADGLTQRFVLRSLVRVR